MKSKLLIFISVYLLGSLSSAQAPQCRFVFAPTLGQIYYEISPALQKIEIHQSNVNRDHIKDQNIKLRKYLQNFELMDVRSYDQIIEAVEKISELKYADSSRIDNLLFKSKDQRQGQHRLRLIEEALLRKGFKNYWEAFGGNEYAMGKRSYLDILGRVLKSKKLDYLLVPWALPRIDSAKLPESLLKKLIIEGYDKYESELLPFLKAQDKVEAYRAFRRLYAPVVVGTILVTQVMIAYEMLESERAKQIGKVISEIRSVQESLNSDVEAVKNEIYKNALKQALFDFEKHWGEPPTELEKVEIQNIIRQAVYNK